MNTSIGLNADWKRPFKNAGKLLVGRGVQGVMSLGYLALAAHALGATGFGILTLIYASLMTVRNFLGFRSWQLIMSFGAQAMSKLDVAHMRKLLNFSFVIEASAAVVGVGLIFAFAEPAVTLFAVPVEYARMFEIYSFLLVFWLVSDVGLGVLRLFDRHDVVSGQLVVEPTIRLIGAVYFYLTSGDVWDFLWVWFIACLLSKITLIFASCRVYKAEMAKVEAGAAPIKRAKFSLFNIYKEPEKGLWRYAWGASVQSALTTSFAPMFIASVLGPAGAGIWRVAQRFTTAISNPINKLLIPAIYTDMSWLNVSGNTKLRRKMIIKTGGVVGLVTLGLIIFLAIFGKWMISIIAGPEFTEAYTAMMILCLGVLVSAFSFGLNPMLMTAGRVWTLTMVRIASVSVFFVTIVPFVKLWGINGAAFSTLLLNIASVAFSIYAARDLIRKPQKGASK